MSNLSVASAVLCLDNGGHEGVDEDHEGDESIKGIDEEAQPWPENLGSYPELKNEVTKLREGNAALRAELHRERGSRLDILLQMVALQRERQLERDYCQSLERERQLERERRWSEPEMIVSQE